MTYPQTPTARAGSAQTAFDAAEVAALASGAMLPRVEAYIRQHGPSSCEEIAAGIRQPGEHLLLTSVRARVCQLRAQGRVIDSGKRSLGESLRAKVVVWRLTTPKERALFAARKALSEQEGPNNG